MKNEYNQTFSAKTVGRLRPSCRSWEDREAASQRAMRTFPSTRAVASCTYHHGNEGTDVTLFHNKLEHRDHGVNFHACFFFMAPFLFKFFFLILFFLFLF